MHIQEGKNELKMAFEVLDARDRG